MPNGSSFGDNAAALGSLLAAPITALQEAQVEAEKQVLDFILEYGLEEVPPAADGTSRPPEIRKLSFEMERSLPDPREAGSATNHRATVSVPLLSIMRLPAIQVSDATIDLTVEIEQEAETEGTGPDTGAAPGGTLLGRRIVRRLDRSNVRFERARSKLNARIVSKSKRTTSQRGKMDIRLTLKSPTEDAPWDQILGLLEGAIQATVELPDNDADGDNPDGETDHDPDGDPVGGPDDDPDGRET
ncbi:DUF2589 domain-containing protein [Nisaea sp.]|uniref:DUF2589 domain-containing protein n=1 Tax=Nisaea sp. TaxID=2024842 RepID=UPI003B529E4B